MEENLDLKKALSTASGSGGPLIPEVVSAGIRRFVENRSPLYTIVPKIAWPTNVYVYRAVTALPTATFAADGAALPSASDPTVSKPTVTMKYVYARGEVTGPMIAAAGSELDAMQFAIEVQADALIRAVEQTIISGDSTSNPAQFDGLIKQITQQKDAASAQLTLALMDEALDIPADYPTHIIMDKAHGRRLWSLLQAQQRFVDMTEIQGGFRVPSYNGLPIIRVDNAITGLSTTVLFPDMRYVVMPINQDITFEPLAKSKDSQDFMLKMYLTLAVEGAARYHSKLVNVTA